MKTEEIKQLILNNYKILSEKSQVKPKQSNIKTTWGLNYRQNSKPVGFVNELGFVRRKKAKIEIRNNEIKTIRKPLFSTWKKTLNNINKMFENMILNFDNSEIVIKKYINMPIYPKEVLK